MHTCTACHGEGEITCRNCAGSGWMDHPGGYGTAPCDQCEGDTTVECSTCMGAGTTP
jgi:hypothetical protein